MLLAPVPQHLLRPTALAPELLLASRRLWMQIKTWPSRWHLVMAPEASAPNPIPYLNPDLPTMDSRAPLMLGRDPS